MNIKEAMKSALADIDQSEAQFGNARPENNSLILAQIAQAKFLAIITNILIQRGQQDRWDTELDEADAMFRQHQQMKEAMK